MKSLLNDPDLRAKVQDLYGDKLIAGRDAAATIGISFPTLKKIAEDMGIWRGKRQPLKKDIRLKMKERIVALHVEEKKNAGPIAEELGLSHTLVRRILKEAGIYQTHPVDRPDLDERHDQYVAAAALMGKYQIGIAEVAPLLGVTRQQVHAYLKTHGLTWPTKFGPPVQIADGQWDAAFRLLSEDGVSAELVAAAMGISSSYLNSKYAQSDFPARTVKRQPPTAEQMEVVRQCLQLVSIEDMGVLFGVAVATAYRWFGDIERPVGRGSNPELLAIAQKIYESGIATSGELSRLMGIHRATFRRHLPEHPKNHPRSYDFLSYVAGFFDADGSVRLKRVKLGSGNEGIEADARLVGVSEPVYRRVQEYVGGNLYQRGDGAMELAWYKQEELRFLLEDITHLSISLQKYRLKDAFDLQAGRDYQVIGEPVSLDSARQLAGDDRYQFQWWALSLVQAKPQGGDEGSKQGKKGADRGVDGAITFFDDYSGKPKRVVVQVKSGKVSSRDIRDLIGTVEREKATNGIFLTLESPSREMITEAASAGHYSSPGWGQDYPRIQIYTVADLLSGAKVNMPPTNITFKQSPKVKDDGPQQKGLFD